MNANVYTFFFALLVMSVKFYHAVLLDAPMSSALFLIHLPLGVYFEVLQFVLAVVVFRRKAVLIGRIVCGVLLVGWILDSLYLCFFAGEHISRELLSNLNRYAVAGFSSDPFQVGFGCVAVLAIIFVCYLLPRKLFASLSQFSGATMVLCLLIIPIQLYGFHLFQVQERKKLLDLDRMISIGEMMSYEKLRNSSLYSIGMAFHNKHTANPLLEADYSKIEYDIVLRNFPGADPVDFEQTSTANSEVLLPQKVVLIVAESFPLEFIGYYNEAIGSGVTPFLDEIAPESFTNFFTAGIPTNHGLMAFLSSFPKMLEGELNIQKLPRILKSYGYKTTIIGGASKYYGYNHLKYRDILGADRVIGEEDFDMIKSYGWGIHDEKVFERSLERLGHDRKELLIIKTLDTHPPYFAPDSRLGEEVEDHFLHALNSFDYNIEKFIAALREQEYYSDSLIIFTSDHNPNHGPYREWTSAHDFSPARLPFIVFGGSELSRRFREIDKTVLSSQLDFLPTFLGLANLEQSGPQLGVSLKDPRAKDREWVVAVSGNDVSLVDSEGQQILDLEFHNLNKESFLSEGEAVRKFLINSFFLK